MAVNPLPTRGSFRWNISPDALTPSSNLVTLVRSWGQGADLGECFSPGDCWALRRGQAHHPPAASPLGCKHWQQSSAATLCIPMLAQGAAVGVLCVRGRQGALERDTCQLCVAVADQVGLALANLELRYRLREQSIRDPLTGLFNRRYMEPLAPSSDETTPIH